MSPYLLVTSLAWGTFLTEAASWEVPVEGGQVVPWNLLSSHLVWATLFDEVYQMTGHILSKPLSLGLSHGVMMGEEE